jgi:hypothetical protein
MGTTCSNCGLEDATGRIVCQQCHASLITTALGISNPTPKPWYDKRSFRIRIIIGIYLLGALAIGIMRGAQGFPLVREQDSVIGTSIYFGFLALFVLPLGLASIPSEGAEIWWLQLLSTVGLIGLPIWILRTQSRRTLFLCCVGFTLVILLLVRGCSSVPMTGLP